MALHAALLATGTEVTSGEVTNRNAAWISERLVEQGIDPDLHMSVPDDREKMIRALSYMEINHDLLVVTGGLGPTSDDVTRDVVAQFVGRPLVFDNPTWNHLQELLTRRGVKISDSHRQQCLFPEGARILINPVGTAAGFAVDKGRLKILVLPGPPREIEGMWPDIIRMELKELSREKSHDLHVWCLFGLPESEAADLTEPIVENTGFQVGYRATTPLVRVKLWIPRGQHHQEVLEKLDKVLGPWVVARGSDEPLKMFADKLNHLKFGLKLEDEVTKGFLPSLVHSLKWEGVPLEVLSRAPSGSGEVPKFNCFLKHHSESEFEIGMTIPDQAPVSEMLKLPPGMEISSLRGQRYIAQRALLWWNARV